jgi:cytochrome b561
MAAHWNNQAGVGFFMSQFSMSPGVSSSMSPARYSKTAMLLHWLIAGALAFQYGLGEALEHATRATKLDIAQFHKAVGITILLLTLFRIGVRVFKPRPAPLGDAGWAQKLASITHLGLYAFMLFAPLTGWLAASTGRFVFPISVWGLFDFPTFPFLAGMEEAARHNLHEFAEEVHGAIAKIGMLLFLLHVAGALRHQFAKKEPLIERMVPVRKPFAPVVGSMVILGLAALYFVLLNVGKLPGVVPPAEPRVKAMATKLAPPPVTSAPKEADHEPDGR